MAQPRKLGSSGIYVQPIGLGGMPMSIQGRPDKAQALETLKAAFEAGIDFVDTADVYCLDQRDIGHNERLIAEAIRKYGADRDIVVATKGGLVRPEGRWERDASPEHLKLACDRSLAALGVDRITLYQLHAPDEKVKFEDSVGALAELKTAGKVAHVGLSNVSIEQIRRARDIVPIVSVQNKTNPMEPRAFRDGVLRYCEQNEIAFLPYSPVGGGGGIARLQEHGVLTAVAERRGATAPQVALAWLLAKSSWMIPIPGASKPENAVSSAKAASLVLERDDVGEIDRAFL